jgi:hypothetical protein
MMLQGVNHAARKRQRLSAPTSFIWCQLRIAAMPIEQRTKGRVIRDQQICHSMDALPNQLQGVIVKTQKCHCSFTPTSFIWSRHDHAAMPRGKRSKGRVTLPMQKCQAVRTLPNQLQGAIEATQKCYGVSAPTEFGPISQHRNVKLSSPNKQRPIPSRRNAIRCTPRN